MSKVSEERRLKILISAETKEPEMLLLGPIPLTDLTKAFLVLAERTYTSDKEGRLAKKDITVLYTASEARMTLNSVYQSYIDERGDELNDINISDTSKLLTNLSASSKYKSSEDLTLSEWLFSIWKQKNLPLKDRIYVILAVLTNLGG